MSGTVAIPFWLLVILLLAAIPTAYRLIVDPMIRRTWKRWSQRALEEVNPSLQLKLSPMTLMRRRSLADRVAHDAILLQRVAPIAAERGVEVADLQAEIDAIAYEIVPAFNPFFYFRLGYWMARHALRSFYRVRIEFEDEKSLEGISNDDSVVFISNHRSNVDYMLLTYLTSQRTMLSFGAGEWSKVFPIEQMLRSAGGYLVRRDSGDPLYRRVLERYVQIASEAKVPHAIFPEGQLSNDGHMAPAKLGILAYITRPFDPETSADITFMPIACNYDRVPEDRNLIEANSAEFRARGKRYVARSGAVFAVRTIWEMLAWRRSYGFACATFGKPWSLKAWLREGGHDWNNMDAAARYGALDQFANLIMERIADLMPMMPVPVLCHILHDLPDGKHSEGELLDLFRQRLARAEARGAAIVLPRNDPRLGLLHALNQLVSRGMMERRGKRDYAPAPDKSSLIDYYANTVERLVRPDGEGDRKNRGSGLSA